MAAASVTSASDAAAKKTAVEKFAKIPALDSGFTLEVKSAAVNATTKSQVDVTVTITETEATTNKTKDAVLKVSGLALSTLEIEAAKFTAFTGTAKTPATKTNEAAQTITDATDAKAKLAALQALTTTEIPTVVEGFSFEVVSAKVGTTNTELDVTIKVSQTGNDKPVEAILKITGFTAPSNSARN